MLGSSVSSWRALTLWAVFCVLATIASATETAHRTSPYYWFSHWVAMGDLDAAAEQFAEEAVVIVAPSCPPDAPCVGRAAIRQRYLTWIAADVAARPLVDQRLDGTFLYAHDARSYRAVALPGADWRDGRYAFHLLDGRIQSLIFREPAASGAASASLSPKRR